MTTTRQSFLRSLAAGMITAISILPTQAKDGLTGAMAGSEYYKVHPLFNPHPVENRNWTVSRFGPVGIGVDLIAPGFTMKIRNVEPGSPAEGKLQKADVLLGVVSPRLKTARNNQAAFPVNHVKKFWPKRGCPGPQ